VDDTRWAVVSFISPFLFFAPDVHLTALERVYNDEIISEVPWKAFISNLNEDWREFVIYATIMCELKYFPYFKHITDLLSVSANTALLAVPDVDNEESLNRNSVQVLSYASIIASIGSIISGLLLIRLVRSIHAIFSC
jgi:hypothetical protein